MDQAQTRETFRIREHYALWRGVRVTDAAIRVGDRTYDIGDLRRLEEKPGRPQPTRRAVLWVAAAQTSVVVLALAGLVHLNGWTVTLYLVAAGQALVTTVVVTLALVCWPTPRELWAIHRGEPTMLYRDADRYEFVKVHRAVQRAIHSHRLLKP
jgi:hypothetical protein